MPSNDRQLFVIVGRTQGTNTPKISQSTHRGVFFRSNSDFLLWIGRPADKKRTHRFFHLLYVWPCGKPCVEAFMIYVVQILRTQFVKIGFTQYPDVGKRIAELQTGNPFQISPLFTVDGTLIQEKAIHTALNDAFAQIKVPLPPNEWYPGRLPFVQTFLNNLKFGANAGLAFADEYNYHGINKGSRPDSRPRDEWKPNFKWPKKAEYTEVRVYGSETRQAV